jgi:hypothetical protein
VLQLGSQLVAGLLQSMSAMTHREQRLLASSLLPTGLNASAAMGEDSYVRAKRQLAEGVRGMIAPTQQEASRAAGWMLLSLTPAPVLGPPGEAGAAIRGAVTIPTAGAGAVVDEAALDGRLAVVKSAVDAARSGVEWAPPDLDALRRAELKADVRRRTDEKMLEALTHGLASDDLTERKAALAALTHCVGPAAADSTPWLEFIAMYNSLEDFAAHLVGAAWAHLETLHPAASTIPSSQHWDLPVDYRYMMAMWTRGLRHSNPAVRLATLELLCGRDWSAQHALLLMPHFVCEVLLPCAMGIAKLSGGGGGASTFADIKNAAIGGGSNVIAQDATAAAVGEEVGRVCGAWVAALGTEDPGQAFSAALAVAAAVAEQCQIGGVSPAGMDVAARAVEAAAVAADLALAQAPTGDDGVAFLESLRDVALAAALKSGPEAQTRQMKRLLNAARCVTPPGRAPLRSMRRLLAAVPPELLASGPAAGVRPEAARWLADGRHLASATNHNVGGGGHVSAATNHSRAGGGGGAGALALAGFPGAAAAAGYADPTAIGRRLMSGTSATDAIAAELSFDPAAAAASWVYDSLLPMFVAFLDGPARRGAFAPPRDEADQDAATEPDDAEGAEAAAAELATLFSFTTGRDLTAQSQLLTAVTAG